MTRQVLRSVWRSLERLADAADVSGIDVLDARFRALELRLRQLESRHPESSSPSPRLDAKGEAA